MTSDPILRTLAGAALALAAIGAVGAVVDAAPHAPGEPVRADRLTSYERRIVHEATRQFRDIEVAVAAGYVRASDCTTHPELGVMGYHYMRPDLAADVVVDPTMPELLTYVVDDQGALRLGSVEWFVADADQDLATDEDRPSLFGRLPFDGPMPGHDPNMPIHYDLHVWLYDHNPAGQLAPFNPSATCD